MDMKACEQRIARREQLLAVVREVLTEELDVPFPPEQIDPDTPLFGLGLSLDSVDAIELILGLEERTGRKITAELSVRSTLRTVNGIVDFLLTHDAAGGIDDTPA